MTQASSRWSTRSIAQYYPTHRAALVSLLLGAEEAEILNAALEKQFVMQFGDLLPKTASPAGVHVVVTDALDEYGYRAEAAYLLFLAESVRWLRVFVTSRPVPEIVGCFASASDTSVLLNINLGL